MNKSRTKQLSFRLSEKELIKFRSKLSSSGLNQQNYIVKAILEATIVETSAIKELLPQLKRIGNNLNQLTKFLNGMQIYDCNAILDNQKELNKIWQSLKQFLRMHQ